MRTRSSWIWCWVVGAVLASGAGAQQYTTIIDNLPTCTGNRNGRIIAVSDAVDDSDCSVGEATGEDRFVHLCICDTLNALGPYWKAVGGAAPDPPVPPDLSGYALLGGRAAGQTLKGLPESQRPRLVLGATTASLIGDGEFAAGVFIDGPLAKLESDTGIGQRNGVEVGSNYINFNLNGTSGVIALDGTAFRLALVPVIPSGDSPPTCDGSLVGGPEAKALYIDNTTGTGTLCMCNGSSWSVLAPAGGSCS